MKKRMTKKNNKIDYFTFEEYLEKYFPKTRKSNGTGIDEPSEMGIILARTSLSKIQKMLSN